MENTGVSGSAIVENVVPVFRELKSIVDVARRRDRYLVIKAFFVKVDARK